MLSWMLLWMTKQAKSLKGEVEGAISTALSNDGARKAVFILIFIAVVREGFETVLFILAKFQQDWTLASYWCDRRFDFSYYYGHRAIFFRGADKYSPFLSGNGNIFTANCRWFSYGCA